MNEIYLALQVLMMPKDTNGILAPDSVLQGNKQNLPLLSIFGGVILSYIDQAGAIGARRAVQLAGGPPPYLVTAAVNRVEFHKPVLVGDVVRFLTRVVRIGRTSITIHINVEVDRGAELLNVTAAEVVYVGIDPDSSERRPVPLLP